MQKHFHFLMFVNFLLFLLFNSRKRINFNAYFLLCCTRYLSTSAGYWGTFEDDSAFFEVIQLNSIQFNLITSSPISNNVNNTINYLTVIILLYVSVSSSVCLFCKWTICGIIEKL